MPNHTVSGNVDTMMRAADNAAIRSAIGVGQTDAPTFLALALTGTTNQLLKMNASNWFGTDTSQVYLYNSGLASPVVSLNNGTNIAMRYDWGLAWTNGASTGSLDTILARDAAGILAQRNGINAQAFRVYNTYTDASSYERVAMGWSAGTFVIGREFAGTGGARNINITGGSSVVGFGSTANAGVDWTFNAGHLLAGTDNVKDIGASGANRPRNVYVGTSALIGALGSNVWWSSSTVVQVGHAALFNSGSLVSSALSLSSNLCETGGGARYISTGFSAKYDQAAGDHAWLTAPSGSAGAAITYTERLRVTNGGLITLGGTTSAFPAIKRNGTGIDIRLADDSGFAPLTASALIAGNGLGGSSGLTFVSQTRIMSASDGVMFVSNNAFTDFNRLQLGGNADTHPAIARDGAGIKFTGAAAGSTSWIKVPAVAVASLPAAATAGVGARSFVNDALAPTFGSAVTGGGAVTVPVYSTGSAWNVG